MGAHAAAIASPIATTRLPGELSGESLKECDELVLLRELLGRNEAAWREFMRRYRALIYHCVNKVVHRLARNLSEADIDEMYAEVLIALLRDDMRKLRTFDPTRGNKLGSWIAMLAINATHDYLRSAAARKPWRERLEAEPTRLFNDPGALANAGMKERAQSPLESLLEKERWSELEEILAEFSDKDRMFLRLYYHRGLDATCIAERMSINVKTVYSKKHKIRASLRRRVRAEGCTCAIRDLAA